jgi:hypothetical protein
VAAWQEPADDVDGEGAGRDGDNDNDNNVEDGEHMAEGGEEYDGDRNI